MNHFKMDHLSGRAQARLALSLMGITWTDAEFFHAVRVGDLAVVELFVQAGKSVETAESKGFTPLVAAAFEGQLAVVVFLVDKGASVGATSFGRMARDYAAKEGHGAVAEYLDSVGG